MGSWVSLAVLENSLKQNWSQYVERLEFFIANDIGDGKILLSIIGPAAYHTLGNLVARRKPSQETYTHSVEQMSTFYNPKPLVTMQPYCFFSRFRQPNESVSAFVAELRSLAMNCDFGASLEDNLRDRLVCGISNHTIQKSVLSEKDLTFKKAFDIAQSYESAAKNLSTLQETSNYQDVHQVRPSSRPCYSCGHQCKFKTATCYYCGKTGHIRTLCRSRKATSHHPIDCLIWAIASIFIQVIISTIV